MISVVTPAHNEEQFLGGCLESVRAAAAFLDERVEHIVVLNRCTDNTRMVAEACAHRIVFEDARNLSRIRNAGVATARGEVLVTIDADSRMSPTMLGEVLARLRSGRYIGGGVRVYPERWSVGIVCSILVVVPFLVWHGVSAGMFWCRKSDFDAIGGFDERMNCIEDIDFGQRLKRRGRQLGQKYGTIRTAWIVTSCRKFDQFGDWYFVRKPWVVYRLFQRRQDTVDEFYYDARS